MRLRYDWDNLEAGFGDSEPVFFCADDQVYQEPWDSSENSSEEINYDEAFLDLLENLKRF